MRSSRDVDMLNRISWKKNFVNQYNNKIMKYVLAIIFLLGYIFLAIAIFTSDFSISIDFALLGLATIFYCPAAIAMFAIAIWGLHNYVYEE